MTMTPPPTLGQMLPEKKITGQMTDTGALDTEKLLILFSNIFVLKI
jgi:hypothetical protein